MARYHMYIGTYTTKGGKGIEHYLFDNTSGGFAFCEAVDAPNPSYLTFSPDGKKLYACLEANLYDGMGGLASYDVAEDGSLTETSRESAAGAAPCHLLVHPSGKVLYAANYVSGSLTQFTLKEDGTLGERTVFQHVGHGVNLVRQEGPHAHCTVLMPGDRTLCVVDLGLDGILCYPLDENGLVSGEARKVDTPAGSGPRHMVFSADGTRAYVVCELGNRILTYKVEGEAMTLLDDQNTLPEDFTGRSACAALRLSADGTRLYLTNRFHDTLAVFAVDKDGMLTRLALVPTGGANPRDCTLAPEGGYILCAHQDSDQVTILKLDAEGLPTLLPTSIAASMPVAVLFGAEA